MKVFHSSPLFILLFVSTTLHAQDGKLDSSFGENGIQRSSLLTINQWGEEAKKVLAAADGSSYLIFNAYVNFSRVAGVVKYLPSGKIDASYGNNGYSPLIPIYDVKGVVLYENTIVIVGIVTDVQFLVNDFVVVRFDETGTLDSTFDEDGIATADFYDGPDRAEDVVIQQNKILVGGTAYNPVTFNEDFAMARFNTDGSLDATFGKEGLVTTDRSQETATAICVVNDKIVLAGTQLDSDFFTNLALVRYHGDGSVDFSFGENGWVTNFRGTANFVEAVASQDEKIVVLALVFNQNTFNYEYVLVRYNDNGLFDEDFDLDGIVSINLNDFGVTPSIAITGEKILVAAHISDVNVFDFDVALTRYSVDGSVDAGFAISGIATVDLNDNSTSTTISISGDQIYVGATIIGIPNDFQILRFTSLGSLDVSFNDVGYHTGFYPSSFTHFTCGLIQDQKIVAAGYTQDIPNSNTDLAITRHNEDGNFDLTFNGTGAVINHFMGYETARALTSQQDKLVVAGVSIEPSEFFTRMRLERYLPDGTLDSTFGTNGLVTESFGGGNKSAEAVIFHSNNLFVAGTASDPFTFDAGFGLAKFNADGKLDLTFGNGGLVLTNLGSNEFVEAMVAQGDKILLAGYSLSPSTFTNEFTLVRYTEDGELDPSFGNNGVVITNFGSNAVARSVVFQDSLIIVAGELYNYTTFTNDFAIARFKWNGDLDSSFGTNGLVTTHIESEDYARSVVVQGDKLIVGGSSVMVGGFRHMFVLVRYNHDGTIDSSFGENGIVKTGSPNESYSLEQILIDKNRIYAVGSIDENGAALVGAIVAYNVEGVTTPACPANISVVPLDGSCTAIVNGIDPILSDAGSDVVYTLTGSTTGTGSGSASGKAFNVGITTVTYAIKDDPTASCSFNVTVTAATEVCNGVDDDCDGVIDETCTEVIVTIDDVSVRESQPFAFVTVRLAGPATNKAVKVMYDIKDLTATHPKDYMLYSRVPLLFAPGGQRLLTIPVQIFPDNKAEGEEQFQIRLKNALNASIKDDLGVVTIIDDDLITNATESNSALAVKASPNPSSTSFTVQLSGFDIKSRASIRVYDLSGRMIESRQSVAAGQTIQLGENYKTGTYIIEAIQGAQRVRTTVIKGGR